MFQKKQKGFTQHQFSSYAELQLNSLKKKGWFLSKSYSQQVGAGFTLIELLVVISIIGLLSSVALVAMNSARDKARYSRAVADMTQITKAVEMYNTGSNSGYPPDVGTDTFPPQLAPYLAKWPKPPCPGWTYDWENWAPTYRISLRRADVGSVFYYCISSTDPSCAGGTEITTYSAKQITCRE